MYVACCDARARQAETLFNSEDVVENARTLQHAVALLTLPLLPLLTSSTRRCSKKKS